MNPVPHDYHTNALPTEISQHLVASLNQNGLYKVMLYDQSPEREVMHETKFTSEIIYRTHTSPSVLAEFYHNLAEIEEL